MANLVKRALKVKLGDLICQDFVAINMDGYLPKNFSYNRTRIAEHKLVHIEFDFQVLKWQQTKTDCVDILYIKSTNFTCMKKAKKIDAYFPKISYCPKQRSIRIDYVQKNLCSDPIDFKIKILKKSYHVKFVQLKHGGKYFVDMIVDNKHISNGTAELEEKYFQDNGRNIYYADISDYDAYVENLIITE